MFKGRFPWCAAIILLLVLGNAVMFYKFIFSGTTVAVSGPDNRTAILLTDDERNLVLTEMRQFLAAAQTISSAISRNDMELVATTAKGVGFAAAQAVPPGLMAKLPLNFKQLGLDTHKGFDQIAIDAKDMGDAQNTQQQLAQLMGNCVACHATFQLRTTPQ